MFKRALATSLFLAASAVVVSSTVVAASGLTDRLASHRMTVLKTDATGGRFLCVEHLKWTAVDKTDLARLGAGDIVRVEPQATGRARLVLLRTAADELSTPER